MILPKYFATICLFAVLLVAHFFSFNHVVKLRHDLPAQYSRAEALMVSPDLLAVVSGEFKGLVADYLVLKAAYFLGGFYTAVQRDWEMVALLFEQALYLESHFYTPMYYAQGILVWRQPVTRRTLDLITVSHKARTWDWEPGFFLGFDYYQYLQDNEKAVLYLREAAERPGAPLLVANLAARFSHNMGQSDIAVSVFRFMYERSKEEWLKKELGRKIAAYEGLVVLEQGVARYRQKYKVNPVSLAELVEKGILSTLPDNPYAANFYYESSSGRLSFEPL